MVIFYALVKDTRSYIEAIAHEINGSYENGWYNSCAVMMRKLIEILIIETFESYGLATKIKNGKGDFFFLRDLISATLSEPAWNLGRNTRKALPNLKEIGDLSSHSRRFIAIREDIDEVRQDLRLVVQELVLLAKLK